ncbi:hypothetical protein ACHQM5_011214 [Ranunculus cassubicifolius]
MKPIFSFVLFLTFILSLKCLAHGGENYVQEVCKVTRFRNLCIHSLSPYSNYAKKSTRMWAEISVGVTMKEAKNVSRYLNVLKTQVRFRRRQRYALSDCIELLQDTMDSLSESLGELKKLEARTFEFQMENVETWLSSGLTDEDTCLEGFSGKKGKTVRRIRNKIGKVSSLTSNALAIVTKLAHRTAIGT